MSDMRRACRCSNDLANGWRKAQASGRCSAIGEHCPIDAQCGSWVKEVVWFVQRQRGLGQLAAIDGQAVCDWEYVGYLGSNQGCGRNLARLVAGQGEGRCERAHSKVAVSLNVKLCCGSSKACQSTAYNHCRGLQSDKCI